LSKEAFEEFYALDNMRHDNGNPDERISGSFFGEIPSLPVKLMLCSKKAPLMLHSHGYRYTTD
jgi:hypothetical protein